MIGVVLITHGQIGQTMLDVASRLVKYERAYVQTISSCTHDQEALLEHVKEAFDTMPEKTQFLVLTDLFGATPTNITQFFMHRYPLAVISGLNMPMLLKALTYHQSNDDLNSVAKTVFDASKSCIVLTQNNAKTSEK